MANFIMVIILLLRVIKLKYEYKIEKLIIRIMLLI